nr:MAG TPA: hypothetical protein [Caudoviricetes sp.]
MILQLTKQSTAQEIKAYFEEVLNLSKDSKDFPVNLDDVWPLVYSAKEKAVRALKSNDLFLQNVDYQVLAQNGENSGVLAQNGGKVPTGRPTEIYMLSVPCLEFFIARKVRPVFEVYRQVFHKVASGELMQPKAPAYSKPCDLATTLKPFVDYTDEIYKRWDRLFEDSNDSDKVTKDYNSWLTAYYNFCHYTNRMVYMETMAEFEGNQFLKD